MTIGADTQRLGPVKWVRVRSLGPICCGRGGRVGDLLVVAAGLCFDLWPPGEPNAVGLVSLEASSGNSAAPLNVGGAVATSC